MRLRDDAPLPYPIEGHSRRHHSPGSDKPISALKKRTSSPSPVSSSGSSRSRSSSSRHSRSSSGSSSPSSSRKSHNSKRSTKRKKKRDRKRKGTSISSHSSPRKVTGLEKTISPIKTYGDIPVIPLEPQKQAGELSSGHESISSDELPYFPDEDPTPTEGAGKRKRSNGHKSPSSSSSSSSHKKKRKRTDSPGKDSISSSDLIYSPTRLNSSAPKESKEITEKEDDEQSIERPPMSPAGSSISSGEFPEYQGPMEQTGFSPHRPVSPSELPPLPEDIDGFQPPLPDDFPPFPVDQPPLPPLPPDPEDKPAPPPEPISADSQSPQGLQSSDGVYNSNRIANHSLSSEQEEGEISDETEGSVTLSSQRLAEESGHRPGSPKKLESFEVGLNEAREHSGSKSSVPQVPLEQLPSLPSENQPPSLLQSHESPTGSSFQENKTTIKNTEVLPDLSPTCEKNITSPSQSDSFSNLDCCKASSDTLIFSSTSSSLNVSSGQYRTETKSVPVKSPDVSEEPKETEATALQESGQQEFQQSSEADTSSSLSDDSSKLQDAFVDSQQSQSPDRARILSIAPAGFSEDQQGVYSNKDAVTNSQGKIQTAGMSNEACDIKNVTSPQDSQQPHAGSNTESVGTVDSTEQPAPVIETASADPCQSETTMKPTQLRPEEQTFKPDTQLRASFEEAETEKKQASNHLIISQTEEQTSINRNKQTIAQTVEETQLSCSFQQSDQTEVKKPSSPFSEMNETNTSSETRKRKFDTDDIPAGSGEQMHNESKRIRTDSTDDISADASSSPSNQEQEQK